ncbi:branched-chain amino acid ABC transporter permease [Variovorax sp. YR216]|uniref:branched-chain amino acid ABC transporter permease n=1 Tax=Variovorax sp. YR216 TaxID=1882828 RepID=UPI00089BC0E6|nr:branched-chain amino acid ABC transporter permease [Variovorax sp. YR216]SEB08065.1 amino acid/amide ABC transporter membrane protein 1, HAAT family [Variovorax sp. YR216]
MDWQILIGQATINGLVVGLLYLLMAVGFTLVFGVMRMVNFAHGEFYMLGAFAAYALVVKLSMPFLLAVAISVVLAIVFGSLIEWLILKPFRKDELNGMIVTIGLALILQNAALMLFGADPLSMPSIASGATTVLGITVANSRLVVVMFAVAVLLVLYAFLRHSPAGRGLRAVVEDAEIAAIQGVKPRLYYPLGFGIGVGLAAIAGALMAPLFSVSPFMGQTPLLKAFMVVILGGLGSIPGAAIAGLCLGLLESYSTLFLSSSTADMLIFVLVVVGMLVFPRGLIGRGEA